MAQYVPNLSGTFDPTVASDWRTVKWATEISSTAGTVDGTSASPLIGETFTPTIGETCEGALFGFGTLSATEVTLKLQEDVAGTWTDRATEAFTFLSGMSAQQISRIDFTTPHTYTTTNNHRLIIYRTSGIGTFRLYVRTGGTASNPAHAFIARIDSTTGTPTTGDRVFLVANEAVGAETEDLYEMELGASWTIGDFGASSSTNNTQVYMRNALYLGRRFAFRYSTTGTYTHTVRGDFGKRFGNIYYGSSATPGTNNVTVVLHQNGVNSNFGIRENGSSGGIYIYGTEKTAGALYVSGTGATGSELVVPSDWAVNDKIVVASGTNYLHLEEKYIKTKPTATTATLSNTVGGAESALTNSYDTSATLQNVTRNFVIESETPGTYRYNMILTTARAPGDTRSYIFEGVQFKGLSGSSTTVGFATTSNSPGPITVRGCAFSDFPAGTGMYIRCKNRYTIDNVAYYVTGSINSQAVNQISPNSRCNITNLWCSGGNVGMININNGAAVQAENVYIRCANVANNSSGYGIQLGGGFNASWKNLDIRSTRRAALSYTSTSLGNVFTDCYFEANSGSTADIIFSADVLVQDTFVRFNHGTILFSGLTDTALGTEMVFDTFGDTTKDHRIYTPTGIRYTSGAGLSDTTTRTAGNYALKLEPSSADDEVYEDKILLPANAGEAVSILLFARRTSTLANATFELYLPGSETPDDTVVWDNTMAQDTWHAVALTADYSSGTEDRYAEIKIKTTGITGNLYVTDFANGTNSILGLTTWQLGRPGPVLFQQIGDPKAVWAVLQSDGTSVSGSMGELANEVLSNTDVTQAKVDQL